MKMSQQEITISDNFLFQDTIVWAPDNYPDERCPNGWYTITTRNEGVVAFASTEENAFDAMQMIEYKRCAERQVGDGSTKPLKLPEFGKLHGYGLAVTICHGLLCAAPMAMDGMILEKDLEIARPDSQNFMDAVNMVLGTSFQLTEF